MAGRRAFQDDPELQQLVLPNVQLTGRQLGVGPYSSVEELLVNGLVCAGRRMHREFLGQDNEGVRNIERKIFKECQVMAKIRHPHLVLFLGLCYLEGSTLPVLVMERMDSSLDDLLKGAPGLPLVVKRSLLADVVRGLLYLHTCNPLIIHRDLSARNILLTSALVAKISDLGNARIMNLRARTGMTLAPGAIAYMPPEAELFHEGSLYGPSLDIFSYGHLALFTLTQVFPRFLLPVTYAARGNQLVARSELERRMEYIEPLHWQLGEEHPLVQMVHECLHNNPAQRPSAKELLQQLEAMRAQIVRSHSSYNFKVENTYTKLQLAIMNVVENEKGDKDREIEHPQQELHEVQDIPVKLKPYARKAKPTGKELGHGTFGIVLEMESAGAIVAGKVFKNVMPHSNSQIEDKLYTEIILMATFQHPNLVQLIGVCFLPDRSNFPVLLMEKMMTDLYTYLMDPQNKMFHFVRKALILHDVASGLSYLHHKRPALVHRDLTSKNVLLTAELTAKIGDFGTGKIMDLDPEATPDTHTTQPGTLGYMPPEAMTGHSQYDTKIDIFAFGHLTLFAILQTQIPLQPPTYPDEQGSLHARSEVKRRQKSIDKASKLLGKDHPLVVLLKHCLHNLPGQRPRASEVLAKIHEFISGIQEKAQEGSQCESSVEDEITLTDEVTLDKLSLMKLPSGERVKIIETVAKDWRIVGSQLNFDRAGNQLDIIERQKSNNPVACCEAMFQHWLNGNGVKPLTWKKLIDILKDCECILLAKQVEGALTQ